LKEKFFEKKKKNFKSFFDLFFGAPSCRLYSPLQVGLNIFGFSDLPQKFDFGAESNRMKTKAKDTSNVYNLFKKSGSGFANLIAKSERKQYKGSH
jgi:hypothetical protein